MQGLAWAEICAVGAEGKKQISFIGLFDFFVAELPTFTFTFIGLFVAEHPTDNDPLSTQ